MRVYNRIRRRIYGGWKSQDCGSLGTRCQQGANGCAIVNIIMFTNIGGDDDDYNDDDDGDVMTKMIMIEIFE